jgi:hypothetical protein
MTRHQKLWNGEHRAREEHRVNTRTVHPGNRATQRGRHDGRSPRGDFASADAEAKANPGRSISLKPSTISALVLIGLGAWTALAGFVVGTWAWEWHFGRFLLAVLPGAAAVLGGLIMLGGRRQPVLFGGALALAGGLWFAFGPPLYAFLEGGAFGTTPDGESVRLAQWVPFFFVAGALISLVSSYALGVLKPLHFTDEMWAESTPTRARVPLPPERPRRQRGVREPATRTHDHTEVPARRDN